MRRRTGIYDLSRQGDDVARAELERVIRNCRGNIRSMARQFACCRMTVYRWIARVNLWEAVEQARAAAGDTELKRLTRRALGE